MRAESCSLITGPECNISRLYERIIYNRMMSHSESIVFFSSNEPGFRPGMSTELVVFRTIEGMIDAWNSKELFVISPRHLILSIMICCVLGLRTLEFTESHKN